MTIQQELVCPNCRSPVKSFQFFGDSCAFCNNALQRGLKGIQSSSILHQGSTRAKETPKAEAPPNVFTLKLSKPIYENEAPFSSFYVNRILKGFEQKHPGFSYHFVRNENGAICEIQITGLSLTPEQKKELESCLQWTTKRIAERRSGKQ